MEWRDPDPTIDGKGVSLDEWRYWKCGGCEIVYESMLAAASCHAPFMPLPVAPADDPVADAIAAEL